MLHSPLLTLYLLISPSYSPPQCYKMPFWKGSSHLIKYCTHFRLHSPFLTPRPTISLRVCSCFFCDVLCVEEKMSACTESLPLFCLFCFFFYTFIFFLLTISMSYTGCSLHLAIYMVLATSCNVLSHHQSILFSPFIFSFHFENSVA